MPQPREQPTVSGRPNGSAIVRSCVRKWRATRISRSADRRAIRPRAVVPAGRERGCRLGSSWKRAAAGASS